MRAMPLADAASTPDPLAPSPATPKRGAVVVTCMDARIDPLAVLGLALGDAHVLRNAGAVVTDDVLRSIALSQRVFATRTVYVMAHTDCGVRAAGLISELDEHVRRAAGRIRRHTALPYRDDVRGCVLDVETGAVRMVDGA